MHILQSLQGDHMRNTTCAAFLLALGLVLVFPLSAQQVADLNDRVYTDLVLWQEQGFIHSLPPQRPYPTQLVVKLLTQVQDSGDSDARQRATLYLKSFGQAIGLHGRAAALLRTDFASIYQEYELKAEFQGSVTPMISFSGNVGAVASNGPVTLLLPEYQRPIADVSPDTSVAPLGTTGLTPMVSMNGGAAFGTDSIYLQAGILRGSFGPFQDDNVVLSSTAPQAGQVSFVVHEDFFTYTSLLLEIIATENNGTAGIFGDKFLSLHSVEVYPLPWLTLGIFESVVWGDRFEPLYLLPFPNILFYAQGMVGYRDNSFVGLSAGVKLPEAIKADFMLYVDDAAFNDLIKLNFNTMMLFAAQGGISWTPHLPFLERLSVGYTMVTPYTYSHIDGPPLDLGGPNEANYQNYTNGGQNMATALEPDSDRIEVKALLRPISFLDLAPFIRFIRHGNGSEGIPGGGDGTIFDTGWVNGVDTFTPAGGYLNPPGGLWTRFMTQSVIEKTLQAGLKANAYFDTVAGHFEGSISYTLQYSLNYNLSSSSLLTNYLSMGFGYSY
jgi:hypothetical protein